MKCIEYGDHIMVRYQYLYHNPGLQEFGLKGNLNDACIVKYMESVLGIDMTLVSNITSWLYRHGLYVSGSARRVSWYGYTYAFG